MFTRTQHFLQSLSFLPALRLALSTPSTSVQLCIIGLLGGLIAAGIIILFRLCLALLQVSILGSVGDYSALPSWQLFLFPIIAVLTIIAIAKLTGFKHYRLGIPFVIHRFKLFYGHIPFVSSINQFFGGILALASGFVVGKEGPTVHLAAAASHYVGRWFKLPFNSLRILAGCGIAAGIAAAFNTPFAAVIFVMEVVMREYKVHIFVPVLLAAACGSFLTRLVFGDVTELAFLDFSIMEYSHFPLLILLGMFLGILASVFNSQLMRIMRLCRPLSMVTRLLAAAVITGAFAFFMPSALGAEFININNFLHASPDTLAIALLFAAKFLLAIVAISLGVPGGIIGAVMVIGILAGTLFLQGLFVFEVDSQVVSGLTENYALLGLAGFLAAVLHAPMAALSAAMELSSTQQVILPAIITIVSAYVTSKQLCANRSIFVLQLDYQGLPYTTTSIRDVLQDTGVMAIMRRDIRVYYDGKDAEMYGYLQEHPDAFVIDRVSKTSIEPEIIDNAVSVDSDEMREKTPNYTDSADDPNFDWNLVSLDVSLQENAYPISLQSLHSVSEQNTLAEVYELLYKKRQGGVVVYSNTASEHENIDSELFDGHNSEKIRGQICGIITWNMLHTYLLRLRH